MKFDKATIIRTVILFISVINVVLNMFDIKTLPVDNEMVNEVISVGILLVSTISSWWHNNSFTEKAKKADEYLKKLKEEE